MPSQNSVSFYSFIDDKTFRIQGRSPFELSDKVLLGYKAIAGDYSISIGQSEGQLATTQAVYLEDKLLETTHNLKLSPYSFQTVAGTFNDRFILKYTTESLSTNDVALQSNLAIAVSKKQVMLKSSEVMSSVKFYDVLGRLVYVSKINATEFTTAALQANGVLIAKIRFANGQTVDRKLML